MHSALWLYMTPQPTTGLSAHSFVLQPESSSTLPLASILDIYNQTQCEELSKTYIDMVEATAEQTFGFFGISSQSYFDFESFCERMKIESIPPEQLIPQYWEPDPDNANVCRLTYDFSSSWTIYNPDDYKKCVCDSLDDTDDNKKEQCKQNSFKFCEWRFDPDQDNLVLSYELSLKGRDYSGLVDRLQPSLQKCYETDVQDFDDDIHYPEIDPKDPMAVQTDRRLKSK